MSSVFEVGWSDLKLVLVRMLVKVWFVVLDNLSLLPRILIRLVTLLCILLIKASKRREHGLHRFLPDMLGSTVCLLPRYFLHLVDIGRLVPCNPGVLHGMARRLLDGR